jgi:hypothetical protein
MFDEHGYISAIISCASAACARVFVSYPFKSRYLRSCLAPLGLRHHTLLGHTHRDGCGRVNL